jgi:MFS family permease
VTAQILIALGLLIGTPFFILFGWLSDKIGRKPIILAGFLLAALTYFPIFKAITHYTNPALEAALASSPVTVIADPSECSFQLKLTEPRPSPRRAISPSRRWWRVRSITTTKPRERHGRPGQDRRAEDPANTPNFASVLGQAITAHGYPAAADTSKINYPMTVLLLTILVVYVTLVYAPIAAWLVELFPTRIATAACRSLPYRQRLVRRVPAATAFAIVRRPATSIPVSGIRS